MSEVVELFPELWFRIAASTHCAATRKDARHYAAKLLAMTSRAMHALFKPVLAPSRRLRWWTWFGAHEDSRKWSLTSFAAELPVYHALIGAVANGRLSQVEHIWKQSDMQEAEFTNFPKLVHAAIVTRRDDVLFWLAARQTPDYDMLHPAVLIAVALNAGYSWPVAASFAQLFGDNTEDDDFDLFEDLFKEVKVGDEQHLADIWEDTFRRAKSAPLVRVAALNSDSSVAIAWTGAKETDEMFVKRHALELLPFLVRKRDWALLKNCVKSENLEVSHVLIEALGVLDLTELKRLCEMLNEWDSDGFCVTGDAHEIAAARGDAPLLHWLMTTFPLAEDDPVKPEIEWHFRCFTHYPCI
jgi:hypothetical protein